MGSNRKELVRRFEVAKQELEEYDAFFDKLKEGIIMYEHFMYDDTPVKLISWNRESGDLTVEYDTGEEKFTDTAAWWNYHFEVREDRVL